jgi:hypothetical protein
MEMFGLLAASQGISGRRKSVQTFATKDDSPTAHPWQRYVPEPRRR